MPIAFLGTELLFPPVSEAERDGLLAVGGDLSTERLLLAYRSGIFPWFDEGPVLWWSPDPRFVLFPEEIRISRSMRTVLNQQKFRFSVNEAFPEVIQKCREVSRRGQSGTWIGEGMIKAYTKLHQLGFACSAEAWLGRDLVGGLYGVRIGRIFFGESMFSLVSNASKFAFIRWVQELGRQGVQLIDCQVYTEHLESLGARMIPRETFMAILSEGCGGE